MAELQLSVSINARIDSAFINLYDECANFNVEIDFMDADIIRLPEQLGPVLRAARQQRGMTQADIALRLGITVQAVSRLENNAGRASFDRIHRLCLLLDLDLLLRPRAAPAATATKTQSEW